MGIREQIQALCEQRVLVLDGAMGTMLQRCKLSEQDYRGDRLRDHTRDLQGNQDVLSLTQPKIVSEIHDQYLAAGADLLLTNTFTCTSISQADYGLQDYVVEMNREAARLARAACDAWNEKTPDRPRFVVGSPRAHQQDFVTVSGRQRSRLSRTHVRPAQSILLRASLGVD